MRTFGSEKSRLLLAALCIAGALLMLIAALTEPGQGDKERMLPMNEAVAAALDAIERESDAVEQKVSETDIIANDKDADGDGFAGRDGLAGGDGFEGGDGLAGRDEFEGGDSLAVQHEADGQPQIPQVDNGGKLDVNKASIAELMELPGIGPSKAQAIVDDRERNGVFRSVDELIRVKGIGEKLLSGLKESVVAMP